MEKYCTAGETTYACSMHAGYLRLQTHTRNMRHLLFFHCNDGCTKAPQCHFVSTLSVLSSKMYVKTRAFIPTNIQYETLKMSAKSWEINSKTVFKILTLCVTFRPTPVATRSKTWVYGCSGLLRLWVRIPPETQISVSWEYFVLSGRGLCVGLITHPEESDRVWCVWMWSWSFDNDALAH